MLNKEQRDLFRKALASYNACGSDAVDIDDFISKDSDVVETSETLENFFDSNGRKLLRNGKIPDVPYERNITAFGEIFVWENVQKIKGARRGNLYVMDFGDSRAAYFDGED